MVRRAYMLGPTALWDKLLSRGEPLSIGEVRQLAVGFTSEVAGEVEFWARVYSKQGEAIPETNLDEYIGVVATLIRIVLEFRGVLKGCGGCIDAMVNHFASALLHALAKKHNLKVLIHMGEHNGFAYVVASPSREGLNEAVKAVEENLERIYGP